MKFIDLGLQLEPLRTKINKRIDLVLDSQSFIMGEEVYQLEKSLSDYVGDARECVSCSSGTDALLMSLMALDVKAGDLIITSPFTYIATAEVISLLGARPVFIDIDPISFNIDPNKLDEFILSNNNPLLKGVIAVDLFGQLADYKKIQDLCTKNNLFLIQDAAQSFGASRDGKRSCAYGDISATSFFPAKPLGCYGDGGAVFSSDSSMISKLKSIREHGKGKDKYDNIRTGINGRLDTIQAAVLIEKLRVFDDEMDNRNRIARTYNNSLRDLVVCPEPGANNISAWAQYSIVFEGPGERDRAIEHLRSKDIPSMVYYRKPLHLQKAYNDLGYSTGDFPIAEKISDSILSLPMHPYLSDEDIKNISDTIKDLY